MNKILPFAAPLQSAAAQAAAARDGSPLLDPMPLLHEEPGMPTRLDADAAVWSPALLKQLLAAEAPATRQQAVRTLTRSLGFDSLVYARFVRQGERWLPQAFCTTYADLGWLQRYVCASYHRVDARLACALRSSLPCIWSIDTLRQDPDESTAASSLTQAFLDDLGSTGARSGALLGLPGSHTGTERHVVSLSSRNEGRAWLNDALLGQVLTLGFCLNDLYTHHLPSPDPAPDPAPTSAAPLNRTQQAILQYLACGLCDKQIAWRLALSLHTVDYHMRQLRKRFGARNRVQLIQAAAAPAAAQTVPITGPIN